jgi:hypothetical protein
MKELILIGLAFALAACGGGGTEGEDPPPNNDSTMVQCTIHFDGFFWGRCPDDSSISFRANQPVFTSLEDCLIAKEIEIINDPYAWDDSQEDRDRGWADQLYCTTPL